MKEEKGNNAYAYISIVAIVAIVALFVMFAGSGNKETQTPQTIVLDGGFGGDLVGDARSFGSVINQNRNLGSEIGMNVNILNKNDFNLVDISRIPKLRNGCTPLTQDWFNTLTGDSLIAMEQGCVTLVEDITTSYTLAIQGNLEFLGEGYQINMNDNYKNVLVGYDNSKFINVKVNYGSIGFILKGNSETVNCKAMGNTGGFWLEENSKAYSSTATGNYNGFILWDNGFTINSTAVNNSLYGFALNYNAMAIFSSAEYSVQGFHLKGDAQVHQSYAANNEIGFYLIDKAKSYDSFAINNEYGIKIEGDILSNDNPTVTNGDFCYNIARNMVVNGAILEGTIYTSPISGFGAYNGNPSLIDCNDKSKVDKAY